MLQLKRGLRLDCLGQPVKQALETAAQIGAEGVEINGRTAIRAKDMTRTAVRHFRKILADLRLNVCAIHFPLNNSFGDEVNLEQRIEATKEAMTMAYDLGCHVVVSDIGSVPADETHPQWAPMFAALTEIGNHGQRTGAWLAAKTTPNTGDGTLLANLIEELPVQTLFVDFDPASFLIGNHNPAAAMKLLAPQVRHFRARDAVKDKAVFNATEVQLGRGSVDWSELLGMLEHQNYEGFITVDQGTGANPVLDCELSLEYLKNLFA